MTGFRRVFNSEARVVFVMTFRAWCHSRILLFGFALPALAGSSVQGIGNFYQVDSHVYRGAQPTNEGFENLAKIGVKTVIDLREADERSKAEEKVVTAAGMRYLNVPMSGLTPPTESEISTILGILEDDSTGPVFVHCKRGADRTGAVIASYRISHDRWDNARALKEAMAQGMSFLQFPRQKYIRTFQSRSITRAAASPAVTPSASDGVVALGTLK
jgi:tyrosine-protein phosphatase SIW14